MDLIKSTTEIEKVVNDFIQAIVPRLEQAVEAFPDVNSLFQGKALDWRYLVKRISQYEREQVDFSNLLSEVSTRKIQLKNFIRGVKYRYPDEDMKHFFETSKSLTNILNDIESSLKSKSDLIKECITTLRSIQSNSSKF